MKDSKFITTYVKRLSYNHKCSFSVEIMCHKTDMATKKLLTNTDATIYCCKVHKRPNSHCAIISVQCL